MSLQTPPRKQRNQFFVDTKTACFLCLREVRPVAPPIITIDLDDEDEEGYCGEKVELEFGGMVRKTDKDAAAGESKNFCLRSIYNYLKMNPGKILSSKLAASSLLISPAADQLLNTDFTVSLCDNCKETSAHLTDLCMEMEVLQMKMAHSLEKFTNALKSSEKDVKLNENFRRKLVKPLDLFQGSVADILRKETHAKCCRMLESSIPKVNLNGSRVSVAVGSSYQSTALANTSTATTTKLVVPPINEQTARNLVTPARYKCKLCGLAFGSKSGLRQHNRRNHSRNPMSSSSSPAALSHSCTACGAVLPSKSDWIRHTRLYCSRQRRAGGGDSHLTATKIDPVVELPTAVITIDNKQNFKNSIISGANNTIPAAVNVPAMLKSLCQLKTFNNQLVCTLCAAVDKNNRFVGEVELGRHIFSRHAECFFATAKLPECSKKQFKEECERMIIKEITMSQTFIRHDDTSNVDKFTCLYCPSEYYHKRSIRAHLIQNHHDRLVLKLVELQKNLIMNPPNDVAAAGTLNSCSKNRSTVRKFASDVLLRRQHKCHDCGDMFVQNSSLWRHRRLYCQYRKKSRDATNNVQAIDSTGLGKSKRKRVGSLGRYKCQDCGAGFAHSPSLWRHRKALNHMTGNVPPSHKKMRKYSCNICGRGFAEQRYLTMHSKSTGCGKIEKKAAQDGLNGSNLNALLPMANNGHSVSVSIPKIVMLPGFTLVPSTPPPLPTQDSTPIPNSTATIDASKIPSICQYCKKSFSSNCVMRRHQRQNCPLAKAAAAAKMYGSTTTEVLQADYFGGDEEVEEVEVYRDSCSDSKIQVLEMSQVEFCSVNDDRDTIPDEKLNFGEIATKSNADNENDSIFVKMEDCYKSEEMTIIPDNTTEDPLLFFA